MKQNLRRNSLTRHFSRRQMLGFIQASTTALLVGCIGKTKASSKIPDLPSQISSSQGKVPTCIVKPRQTEGPYFVDERLNRSDIRSDPSDRSVKAGAELSLAFRVLQVNGNSCVPLPGATVDIWHCDAMGVYSDVQDRSFDTSGKKFLRGYQVTDEKGIAQFITIYPGWYEGRTVHIHFKIRTESSSQQNYEFTSQLYFDDSLTDRVQVQSPYSSKGKRTLKNDEDRIFQDGGQDLILQLINREKGYAGTFDVGIQTV
jgi:protocatechuate 3,4-dioxygenase beta subunit